MLFNIYHFFFITFSFLAETIVLSYFYFWSSKSDLYDDSRLSNRFLPKKKATTFDFSKAVALKHADDRNRTCTVSH